MLAITDQLVRLHLKGPDLLVVGVLCTDSARQARKLHQCLPTSATLLAQGIAAGFGMVGLLDGKARINLQVACDGPLKGLFVDADRQGTARGYVKNTSVNFVDAPPQAALGGQGTLSVLRELREGEIYRGAIELESLELSQDLERYYLESEQIETIVALEVTPGPDEPLGRAAGLFVQRMPGAEPETMEKVREALHGARLPTAGPRGEARAFDLTRAVSDLFPGDWELLAEHPLSYECGCSSERVLRAITAMGREEIEKMLAEEGFAVATCVFCNKTYRLDSDELRALLARMVAAGL